MDVFSTEQETPLVDFKREGIKIGIINGLFAMILMYGSYFMGMDTFMNQQYISAFLPYMIIVLLIAGFQLRKKNGGYLSFKEAIKFTFVSYVIAAVIIALGTYILFNLIDKDLTEKTFKLGIEKSRALMERMGASDDEVEKTIGKLEKQKAETGVQNIILGTGMELIWAFVKSLLISLVIRKEKPAFLQQ
ncbi:DUF4199 domain-containing protein [Flavisolibacter tropicus]|uniref:DUF4199 domain-containing protein n=1 Tax=Flavisolibacter tropicus TaxID=1492898 RepID=A0A172TQM7_9BACT|nr:DUF4199 domain-containing protein [Flavisolibacter tropicus]ANE49375.1 hypothetical protein SY85_01505 [Flavisolibacter tropicus]